MSIPDRRPHKEHLDGGKGEQDSLALGLTYQPLNNRIKRILLDNFKVVTDHPATTHILFSAADSRISLG